jgi:hypothetical protein
MKLSEMNGKSKILCNFLVLAIVVKSTLSQKYSFCSNGKQYVFSEEACPGGVFLKSRMEIDEPCHCFSSE